MKSQETPVVKKKKVINIKKLVKLAKEVRKIFEEEERRLIEKGEYGANSPTRFLLND